MGLLTDYDIRQALDRGGIGIDPFTPANLGPASYDVTLSSLIRRPRPGLVEVDLADVPEGHTELVDLQGQPLRLHPGEFVLASTVEVITLGLAHAARYEGRSSLGRLGLATHVTAGFIDPGFTGHVTLEIVNHAPYDIVLHPGMRIGQLCVFLMHRATRNGYGQRGHYQGQQGPTESRFRL